MFLLCIVDINNADFIQFNVMFLLISLLFQSFIFCNNGGVMWNIEPMGGQDPIENNNSIQ